MKEKEQYLGLLRQLKDFDDERSRVLAAQAYVDQEKKRLEVSMRKPKALRHCPRHSYTSKELCHGF